MNSLKIKTIEDYLSEGKSPEILFWVGCAGSFDDRAKKITRSFVKIMNRADVKFGVLEDSANVKLQINTRFGHRKSAQRTHSRQLPDALLPSEYGDPLGQK